MYAYALVLSRVQVKFDHFQSIYILYYNFTFFADEATAAPMTSPGSVSSGSFHTKRRASRGESSSSSSNSVLTMPFAGKRRPNGPSSKTQVPGHWVRQVGNPPPPSWKVIENMYAKNSSNCFAQKTNSIKPNRADCDPKGQRRDEKNSLTLISNHFLYTFNSNIILHPQFSVRSF